MRYVHVPEPKSELLSLVGTLAKRLDWNIYGSQMVDAKKAKWQFGYGTPTMPST